jgi:hypothetical protein
MPAIHLIFDADDRLQVPIEMLSKIGASCVVLRLPSQILHAEEVPELSRELARLFLTQLAIDHGGG